MFKDVYYKKYIKYKNKYINLQSQLGGYDLSGPPTAIRNENEIDTDPIVPIIPFRHNAVGSPAASAPAASAPAASAPAASVPAASAPAASVPAASVPVASARAARATARAARAAAP